MSKFCGKCGKEITEEFCTNCGAKATDKAKTVNNNNVEVTVVNKGSDMEQYFHDKMMAKKKHNTYRTAVGVIMLILGFLIFLAGILYDDLDVSVDIGDASTVLAFVLPGLFTFIGGILSIASKKNNVLLMVSGVFYILAALINAIAIANVSLLFILCCCFAPINIVYYSKSEKIGE